MKIPQELKDYKHNKDKYNGLLEELEVLKTRATKITSVLSDMPRGNGNQDKLGNCVAEIVETTQNLAETITEMDKQEIEIKNIISQIEQPYQNVLYKKYILGKTVAEISVDISYSYEQTKRFLKKGNKIYENMTQNDLE